MRLVSFPCPSIYLIGSRQDGPTSDFFDSELWSGRKRYLGTLTPPCPTQDGFYEEEITPQNRVRDFCDFRITWFFSMILLWFLWLGDFFVWFFSNFSVICDFWCFLYMIFCDFVIFVFCDFSWFKGRCTKNISDQWFAPQAFSVLCCHSSLHLVALSSL